MRLPSLPTLPKIEDRSLYNILTSLIGVIRIRFYGGTTKGETVVLHKELPGAVASMESGFTGVLNPIVEVRLTDGVLETRTTAVSIEKGRIVNVQENEWGA
ncbi:hypothetical protein [Maridesulfovibrio sp.]|uniref:hypothetical protein n=1 Tax=Maridesulfovibrio sp. TaxID=2795000 RepID=UPI0029C9D81A|nr:hypothetical protein [Maridesulfovibrio sp.]